MNIRLLFGKPLPRALRNRHGSEMGWSKTLFLLAGAGVITWVVMKLLGRDAKETEDIVYFWPE
jgi:hypothetical protein